MSSIHPEHDTIDMSAFDLDCEIRPGGKPCPTPATYILHALRHCLPGDGKMFICEEHLTAAIGGCMWHCPQCSNLHPASPRILGFELIDRKTR